MVLFLFFLFFYLFVYFFIFFFCHLLSKHLMFFFFLFFFLLLFFMWFINKNAYVRLLNVLVMTTSNISFCVESLYHGMLETCCREDMYKVRKQIHHENIPI